MLRIAPKPIAYHGWHIKVAMQDSKFCFHCYPPERPYFCNDGCIYSTFRAALHGARQFVDREVAVKALLDITCEWLEDGRISEEEYWNLTDFE